MNFEQAKAQLVKNAVGSNDYENITTWEELEEKAVFEQSQALFHADQLGDVVSAASENLED
ncbi:hypothetical protein RND59_05540 [Vibrio ruber]|uniref:hypothetical protein n=1 Tax=Vibrio ruber TaxID=184755 RepID=UPI0028929B56|nr:hypothetical protein [Vibrio ruber]WNJ96559.1 hypothetical protein RND59_05540 [Vibrio ruber]